MCTDRILMLALVAVFCSAAQVAPGAELHFRPECRVAGSVVLLGDIAAIESASDTEKAVLGRIELFHAPSTGQTHTVHVRQIDQLLARHQIDQQSIRFSAASQVQILGTVAKGSGTQPDIHRDDEKDWKRTERFTEHGLSNNGLLLYSPGRSN